MPDDATLPIKLDDLPLVARTELRDVRTVSVEAVAPDLTISDAEVRADVTLANPQYRFQDSTLLVRFQGDVRYLRTRDTAPSSTDRDVPETEQIGHVTVGLMAELEFTDGDYTDQQMEEFLAGNLMFMVFPYMRSALHQAAADVQLPPVVLPFLRRPGVALNVLGTQDSSAP